MTKKPWKFENGYWIGPDWPLSILYWMPAVLMSGIALTMLVLLVVMVVVWWM